MEKNVDKLFDEMLDSVMEFDNNYDNSSFNVWNIDEDYEENEVEDFLRWNFKLSEEEIELILSAEKARIINEENY